MAVVDEITAQQIRRHILLQEGVFNGAATADADLLDMFWRAHEGDEYQERLRAISILREVIPGLLICHVCRLSGLGLGDLIALPCELHVEALRVGWRYDEEDRWMCPGCIGGLHGWSGGEYPRAP